MVGVVCTVWVGRPGIVGSIPGRSQIFLFYPQASRTVLRLTQSPIQFVSETLSRGLKRPAREADRSFSSSAEVKNTWRNKSTPPYEVRSLPVALQCRTHEAGNNAVLLFDHMTRYDMIRYDMI
jgi:hypothetical protein